MLFNSIQFLIFYPLVTILYFGLPHRFRWMMLLAASCYFYMAFVPVYILILLFTILIDFAAGISIEEATGSQRRLFLLMSLVANLGVLGFFKYFNFVNANMTAMAHFLHWNYPIPFLRILLPISLSFHTFQSMSYTIEVYRGNQKAERNLGLLALYVMFYPQLVAGPIERPQNLLHQFKEVHHFREDNFASGFQLMLWGLFKKCVIADRLALYVNQVYDHPFQHQGLPVIVSTVFFAVQIYCDFSGYSDVAIGSARTMGFTLMRNFNHPYGSKSIPEFWTKWHISLSTFFRDYLYIPLGGNKCSRSRWTINILIVFVLSGLWHGAAWTFIAWGALHGIYVVFSRLTSAKRTVMIERLGLSRFHVPIQALRIWVTFSLVSIAWIFFRARSLAAALYMVGHLFSGLPDTVRNFANHAVQRSSLYLNFSSTEFNRALIFSALVFFVDAWVGDPRVIKVFDRCGGWGRFATLFILTLAIFNYGIIDEIPFIYFQF